MDSPQFFGSYVKEKMCRFFRCKKGQITSENVETECVFQGSFPWKTNQTLEDSGKREIIKACTISYLKTVKECEEDLEDNFILSNLKWVEDCSSDQDCQAIDQIACTGEACDIEPDDCFKSSESSDSSEASASSSHPNPSPSPHRRQVSSEEENDQNEEVESGFGENEEESLPSSGDGETEFFGWQKQVTKDMKDFINSVGEDDDDGMIWSNEGRRLFMLTLDKPDDQMTVSDIWSTGVESIRLSKLLGQEVHQLQGQIDNMSMWSWRFNIGLLLPTSLAVATSLLILGNFCYKSHKFIAERVNRVWTEKTTQRILKTEKAKNLDAIDLAIRIESMKLQGGKGGGHFEKSGIIRLTDNDGRLIGQYDPNVVSAIPEDDQPVSKKEMPANSSAPPLHVSTHMIMETEKKGRKEDKEVSLKALYPDVNDISVSTTMKWEDVLDNDLMDGDE